jgi:hypothetical protein
MLPVFLYGGLEEDDEFVHIVITALDETFCERIVSPVLLPSGQARYPRYGENAGMCTACKDVMIRMIDGARR